MSPEQAAIVQVVQDTLNTPTSDNTTAPPTQAAVSQPGQSGSTETADQTQIISEQPPAADEDISVVPPQPGMEPNIVERFSDVARDTSTSSSGDDTNRALRKPSIS